MARRSESRQQPGVTDAPLHSSETKRARPFWPCAGPRQAREKETPGISFALRRSSSNVRFLRRRCLTCRTRAPNFAYHRAVFLVDSLFFPVHVPLCATLARRTPSQRRWCSGAPLGDPPTGEGGSASTFIAGVRDSMAGGLWGRIDRRPTPKQNSPTITAGLPARAPRPTRPSVRSVHTDRSCRLSAIGVLRSFFRKTGSRCFCAWRAGGVEVCSQMVLTEKGHIGVIHSPSRLRVCCWE